MVRRKRQLSWIIRRQGCLVGVGRPSCAFVPTLQEVWPFARSIGAGQKHGRSGHDEAELRVSVSPLVFVTARQGAKARNRSRRQGRDHQIVTHWDIITVRRIGFPWAFLIEFQHRKTALVPRGRMNSSVVHFVERRCCRSGSSFSFSLSLSFS